jgi:hypothetical protein
MSVAILSAIRQHAQLKGSLKLTAQEIAHRASSSGFVRVSYGYLASKTGMAIRTMIRHVHLLEGLGILRKHKVWISANRCAVNVYTLLIRPLHTCASDKVASRLPDAGKERESYAQGEGKYGTIQADLARWEKALRFTTPGSDAYITTLERVERLRAFPRGR